MRKKSEKDVRSPRTTAQVVGLLFQVFKWAEYGKKRCGILRRREGPAPQVTEERQSSVRRKASDSWRRGTKLNGGEGCP